MTCKFTKHVTFAQVFSRKLLGFPRSRKLARNELKTPSSLKTSKPQITMLFYVFVAMMQFSVYLRKTTWYIGRLKWFSSRIQNARIETHKSRIDARGLVIEFYGMFFFFFNSIMAFVKFYES